MTNLNDLLLRIHDALPDETDRETMELIERVASMSALFAARAAVGENVDVEMRHLKAQAANLSAEHLKKTMDATREWLMEAVGKVVAGVL